MKYNVGDVVIIDNNYLRHTLSIGDQYNNIAIIKDFYQNEKDSYRLIIGRNNAAMYTSGATIKEDGIVQLFPVNVNVKYTYFHAGAERECYINNSRKLIDSLTGEELDYMNLIDFRIISSCDIKNIRQKRVNNILLNRLYNALGR